jgi:hypothetical protein
MSFWGGKISRLSQLKTKYDPNMLFWVTPVINADKMQVADGRLCKADSVTFKSALVVPPTTDN